MCGWKCALYTSYVYLNLSHVFLCYFSVVSHVSHGWRQGWMLSFVILSHSSAAHAKALLNQMRIDGTEAVVHNVDHYVCQPVAHRMVIWGALKCPWHHFLYCIVNTFSHQCTYCSLVCLNKLYSNSDVRQDLSSSRKASVHTCVLLVVGVHNQPFYFWYQAALLNPNTLSRESER